MSLANSLRLHHSGEKFDSPSKVSEAAKLIARTGGQQCIVLLQQAQGLVAHTLTVKSVQWTPIQSIEFAGDVVFKLLNSKFLL